jgi:tetratricopeptide (TPR) repeat protein
LRAAGVEVWFDAEGGLEHGDEWDAKIRRQIKECVLFIAVISANTQAREEGYFRIEWDLAAERARGIASGVAFILPIVIDDTREPDALVPDRFRKVQWTRLPAGELTPEVKTRFLKLWSHRTGVLNHQAERSPGFEPRPEPPVRSHAGIYALAAAVVVAAAVGGWFMLKPRADSAGAAGPAASPPGKLSEARQLAAKAQLLFEKVDSTQDDFTAAEGLMQRAVALDPADGLVLAIYSRLNTGFNMRGFDHSAARVEEARSQMERAMLLAPEEPEVWLARGSYLRRTDGNRAEAEQALRQALALAPQDTRPWFDLAWAVAGPGKDEEVFALLEKSIDPARPGSGALARYNQFNLRFGARRFAQADALARAAVAELPATNFVTGLARHEITWKGDAAAAVAAIEQMSPERLKEPRAVYSLAYARLLAREPAEALKVLRRLPNDFIADSYYTGPKGYWEGRAQHQLGNAEAARVAWEAALTVSRREGTGRSGRGLLMQAELLASLGREEEALRTVLAYEQAGGTRGISRHSSWIYSAAKVHAVLGRVEEALPLLEAHLVDMENIWPLTPALLRLDPLWDKIRGDPRFQKLLADTEAAQIVALPSRVWPKDPELKRAVAPLDRLDAIPEDFRLAEEIAQPVLDKSPTDPETVTVMARVHSMWLLRGWDRSTARYQKAKSTAERALQLAPDEPEALAALATYLYTRGSENQRALDLAQRSVDLAPQESRFHRLRDNCLFALNFNPTDVFTDLGVERQNAAVERALASARRTVELFPQDALVRYELARHYRDLGRWAEFEQATDATLALAPVANAIVWKARARFGLHGDLAGMKALLDRVPPRVRGIERTVFSYFLYSAFTGDTREGLDALNGMPESWMIDFDYRGPKALPVGALLELQGKKELARLQYEAALAELQRARGANPVDVQTYLIEAWIQHGLGRGDEARAALRIFNESVPRPYNVSPIGTWWFQPIAANLLMGEWSTALTLMREAAASLADGRAFLLRRLAMDRRLAPFRDDPEITALLAEPEAKK